MQIDWLSAIVATPPDLAPGYTSGEFLRIDQHGEIVSRKPSALDVHDEDASSSRSVRVWTPQPHVLHLSGNPVKLVQGHNLFGSCDVPGLYLEQGDWIRRQVGMFPSPGTWATLQFGLPRFTRLDVTRSCRCQNVSAAQSFIRHVAGAARSRHGAATLYNSETAVFGEGSRRWSFTIYDKFAEMQRQKKKSFARLLPGLGEREGFDDELMDWSQGVVRFELRLRFPELEDLQSCLVGRVGQTERVGTWESFALELWQSYYSRITFNENAVSATKGDLMENTLNGAQRACLELWRVGKDLRAIYPKRTFYFHRRALLELLAVDIASPPPASDVSGEASQDARLDPAGWDPAAIAARQVEPRAELKTAYELL